MSFGQLTDPIPNSFACMLLPRLLCPSNNRFVGVSSGLARSLQLPERALPHQQPADRRGPWHPRRLLSTLVHQSGRQPLTGVVPVRVCLRALELDSSVQLPECVESTSVWVSGTQYQAAAALYRMVPGQLPPERRERERGWGHGSRWRSHERSTSIPAETAPAPASPPPRCNSNHERSTLLAEAGSHIAAAAAGVNVLSPSITGVVWSTTTRSFQPASGPLSKF